MIFDGENLFFRAKALSAADIVSDVVKTGKGDAYDPMKLVLSVADGDSGKALTTKLQTSADEAFTTPVTLATFTEVPLSSPVPRGDLGYLRLVVTSTYTAGTMTSGLVMDDNIA
jgi:hypothetical protein